MQSVVRVFAVTAAPLLLAGVVAAADLRITVKTADDGAAMVAARVLLTRVGDPQSMTRLSGASGEVVYSGLDTSHGYAVEVSFDGFQTETIPDLMFTPERPELVVAVSMKRILRLSLVALIASPLEHDRRPVRVSGFLSLKHEDRALYLHEDDWKHGITRNGIWLSLSRLTAEEWRKFDRRYVSVEGEFAAGNPGHSNLFSGSLENARVLGLEER